MRATTASATAYLIAESTVLSASTPALANLIPAPAARLSARFIEPRSTLAAWGRKVRHSRLGRKVLDGLEQATIPGLRLHYALRKRFLEDTARAAIADGFGRIVVFGAGFDTLALRLSGEFPNVQFLEIDHPATQHAKTWALPFASLPGNIQFLPLELAGSDWPEALKSRGFQASPRTLFIAEGLLMYLTAGEVGRVFDFVAAEGGAGSRLAFTFMELCESGRIAFHQSTFLVDLWLGLRGEQFKWGIAPALLAYFLDQRGFIVRELADARVLRARYLPPSLAQLSAAEGESICVADVRNQPGI